MAGGYAQYNLAHEPAALRAIMEANAGVRLSGHRAIWFDAGVLPSHIGSESAIGADCWNLSRSIWAENTPYYEAGARLSSQWNKQLYWAVFYLNGWQRVQRLPGQNAPNIGTQLTWTTGNGTVLNWSTFVGSDQPDSTEALRIYNNVYAKFDGDTLGITLGFDMGLQRNPEGRFDGWFGPVVVVRQRIARNWFAIARGEFVQDDVGVILEQEEPLFSGALGFDRRIGDHVLWRVEGRWMGSEEPIFRKGQEGLSPTNMALSTALTLRF